MSTRELTIDEVSAAYHLCIVRHGAAMIEELTADADAGVWPPCDSCRADIVRLVDAPPLPEIRVEDVVVMRRALVAEECAGTPIAPALQRILAVLTHAQQARPDSNAQARGGSA